MRRTPIVAAGAAILAIATAVRRIRRPGRGDAPPHVPASAVGAAGIGADGRSRVIWIVNQYAGSPTHGMEFRHYELGRELQRSGATVVIVSGSFSHLYARQPEMSGTYTTEDIDGLTYCWVRVPRYERAISLGRVLNMGVFMIRLFRLPLERLPAPDAIIASSPSLFPILPAERWARRFHCPLIFEVRDLWPLTLQELGGLSARHPAVAVFGWFERRAYRVADIVVSVLPAAASHIVAHGAQPSKVRVIQNGVSDETLKAAPTAPPESVTAATAGAGFTVGFVGTLGLANALETLIEAGRLLAGEDVRIVIVGAGPDDERLRSLASGLTDVVFTGPIAKTDVPATLRLFDACYVGYHRTPLYRFGISPNKVFDYMAAGRPVILAAEAANDLVGDAECGLTIAPDDPAALAEAIRALRSMTPAERERLGANGRAYVVGEHSYANLAGRYAAVIDEAGA